MAITDKSPHRIAPQDGNDGRVRDALHHGKTNASDGFERCRHTRGYLDFLRRTCRVRREELAAASGFTDVEHFETFCSDWHRNLATPVRTDYLLVLGVDLNLLREVVEVDRQDFAQALGTPRRPRAVAIQLAPGVWPLRPVPREWTEEGVLRWMEDFSKERGLTAVLHYPNLVTHVARPQTGLERIEYWPKLVRTASDAVGFGDDGEHYRGIRFVGRPI